MQTDALFIWKKVLYFPLKKNLENLKSETICNSPSKNAPEIQQNIEVTENYIDPVNENINVKKDSDIPILDKVERYVIFSIILW